MPAAVAGGEHAAHEGDAQRGADLPGRVVDRRGHALLGAPGSDDTMALVAGRHGQARRRRPRISWATSSTPNPLPASSVEKRDHAARRVMASRCRSRASCPYRIESGAATVEIGIIRSVIGRQGHRGLQRAVAQQELQVLEDHQEEPEQGDEEHEQRGRARRRSRGSGRGGGRAAGARCAAPTGRTPPTRATPATSERRR